jgi:hypothetical protein
LFGGIYKKGDEISLNLSNAIIEHKKGYNHKAIERKEKKEEHDKLNCATKGIAINGDIQERTYLRT